MNNNIIIVRKIFIPINNVLFCGIGLVIVCECVIVLLVTKGDRHCFLLFMLVDLLVMIALRQIIFLKLYTWSIVQN